MRRSFGGASFGYLVELGRAVPRPKLGARSPSKTEQIGHQGCVLVTLVAGLLDSGAVDRHHLGARESRNELV
ncbi:unannotated protein [freshwater metagenome]|uniref:Unannotated protein n=1 Tax=freshwater metagenome TaxID=449393 RepID=A0A6J6ZVZ0_9ZZZZ